MYNDGSSNRITIFVGEFGSGKTEIAVNYALNLKKKGYKTALVDMDIKKPYFRAQDHRKIMEQHGIELIAKEQKLANADLPTIPNNLIRVLLQQEYQVVMDVGGGESSIVLGQFHEMLSQNTVQALLVVNTLRPATRKVPDIVSMFHKIQNSSRLKIKGLISNTNLGTATNEQHIVDGLAIIEKTSNELSIPICWVVIPNWLDKKVETHYCKFLLQPFTRYLC